MDSLFLLSPVLVLTAFAFVLFGVDALTSKPSATSVSQRLSFWLALLALAVASVCLLQVPSGLENPLFGRGMLVWDGLSYFFSWMAIISIFLVVLMSDRYRDFAQARLSSYFAFLLLAGVGLIFLVSANDFLMIFIGIELVGIPSFIMAGFLRHKQRSSEAAVKFFLIGAFSSAMLAYGISIFYGITGSTSLSEIATAWVALQEHLPLTLIASALVIVSFGFKMALAPFHMWVPDVFEGAPAPVAAFLSVAPKAAGTAVALRVFTLTLPQANIDVLLIFAVLAVLTMTIGNFVALHQFNVIRLLAYSSIAHMGYLLLGLVAGGELGVSSVYLYLWTYLFMNLGAFGVVIYMVNATGSSDISTFNGLAKRSPFLSALMVLFLLSLSGIPPTAGFVAKFYVFSAAYQAGWLWIVIAAVINTVVAVVYYFKIVRAMYFNEPSSSSPVILGFSDRLTLGLTSFLTLGLGIAPQIILVTTQSLAVFPLR